MLVVSNTVGAANEIDGLSARSSLLETFVRTTSCSGCDPSVLLPLHYELRRRPKTETKDTQPPKMKTMSGQKTNRMTRAPVKMTAEREDLREFLQRLTSAKSTWSSCIRETRVSGNRMDPGPLTAASKCPSQYNTVVR